jgi:DNA-directed RNA polymerase
VKKPLGKRGVYWLKVHIANCFGFDKERFDVRARWTEDNWGSIHNALDEPENHADVWGTDAPWGMFSAAYELNQAYLSGNPEAYETGVFVHMDATCSGLQHFSAMLRDPIGGEYTNLFDDSFVGPKQDIYSRVATNALAAIKLDSEDSDPEKAAVALWWLKAGIPRNMAKTPVMTYCYGATLRGTVDFVHTYVQHDMGLSFPADVRPYDYAVYAAKKLFTGIAATVPAAESAMQWLKGVAKQMPKGMRMEWTSPTGFLVQHDYQDYDEIRVRIRSCGVETALVREFNDDTRPAPMQNAISPNFVHALDASHLTLTANRMKALGLHMVGIHDSFGTHPSDVDAMNLCIRQAFIELYKGRNVLSEFLWEVGGIGEVPMRGTLDLDRVLDSEFFFC